MVEAAINLARQAQERGELSPEVDPAGVALLVLGALQGLQLLIAMFGDEIDHQAATRALLDALSASRPNPGPV